MIVNVIINKWHVIYGKVFYRDEMKVNKGSGNNDIIVSDSN